MLFFQLILITGAKLEKIAENAFGGLKAVERLLMYGNDIKHIPNIDPLKPTLKELQLQRNKISEIDENYFKGFGKLEDIFLDNNLLTLLPNLSWLGATLYSIRFDDNQVVSLDGLILGGHYPKLFIVSAINNNLTYFDPKCLLIMPTLVVINLAGNRLVHMDDFRHFFNGRIILTDNPWVCDHNLSWMRDLDRHQHQQVLCYSPWCLSGRDIASLGKLLTQLTTVVPFYQHGLSLILARISNYTSLLWREMKLLNQSQTSTVAPLKFGMDK